VGNKRREKKDRGVSGKVNQKKEVISMGGKISLSKAYIPSEDVVTRDIQGELIIVPIISGIGDIEDAIFTLNETGRAVWEKLDGKKTLSAIIKDLSVNFKNPVQKIEKDVLGFMEELFKRKMLAEVK